MDLLIVLWWDYPFSNFPKNKAFFFYFAFWSAVV